MLKCNLRERGFINISNVRHNIECLQYILSISCGRQVSMEENSTFIEKAYYNPISDVKITSDELVTMRAITKLTADWYPNEYHFISEELFKNLCKLTRLVTKNTQLDESL